MKHYLYVTLDGTEVPLYAQDKYGKRGDDTIETDNTRIIFVIQVNQNRII